MQRTRTILVCDMHQAEVEATGSLDIILNGIRSHVDLCPDHMTEALRTLRPWLRAGLPAGARGKDVRRSTTVSASTRRLSAAVRAWAAENGYDLPDRGRIPRSVHEAYQAANPDAQGDDGYDLADDWSDADN